MSKIFVIFEMEQLFDIFFGMINCLGNNSMSLLRRSHQILSFFWDGKIRVDFFGEKFEPNKINTLDSLLLPTP